LIVNEQQRVFSAAGIVGALAKGSQQERRGEFAIAQEAARLVEMLERFERKKQRHDQNQRDREKPPREAGAQSHFNFWSGDKRLKLSPLTGGRNGNAMIVSRHVTPNRNPFVTWEKQLPAAGRAV